MKHLSFIVLFACVLVLAIQLCAAEDNVEDLHFQGGEEEGTTWRLASVSLHGDGTFTMDEIKGERMDVEPEEELPPEHNAIDAAGASADDNLPNEPQEAPKDAWEIAVHATGTYSRRDGHVFFKIEKESMTNSFPKGHSSHGAFRSYKGHELNRPVHLVDKGNFKSLWFEIPVEHQDISSLTEENPPEADAAPQASGINPNDLGGFNL